MTSTTPDAQFIPKVSIVIPVYNGSNYLREAIGSALDQSYKNCEVIVINDGSDDNGATEQIALSFNDRIRYFRKENGGVASALNMGIREMKGEYLSWLSHDDVFYPNKVEAQVNYLNAHDSKEQILYSNYDLIDCNSNVTGVEVIEGLNAISFRLSLILRWPIHGCTALIPKSIFLQVGYFDESLRTTQDYHMWFRMAERFNFVHIPDVLIHSRIHPEQTTVALNRVCRVECDQLYIWMLQNLTDKETTPADGDIGKFYSEIVTKLKGKGSMGAARYAMQTGLKSAIFNRSGKLVSRLASCAEIVKSYYGK